LSLKTERVLLTEALSRCNRVPISFCERPGELYSILRTDTWSISRGKFFSRKSLSHSRNTFNRSAPIPAMSGVEVMKSPIFVYKTKIGSLVDTINHFTPLSPSPYKRMSTLCIKGDKWQASPIMVATKYSLLCHEAGTRGESVPRKIFSCPPNVYLMVNQYFFKVSAYRLKRRITHHSVFNDLTGLANAALMAWKLTVNSVSARAPRAADAKIHHERLAWYR